MRRALLVFALAAALAAPAAAATSSSHFYYHDITCLGTNETVGCLTALGDYTIIVAPRAVGVMRDGQTVFLRLDPHRAHRSWQMFRTRWRYHGIVANTSVLNGEPYLGVTRTGSRYVAIISNDGGVAILDVNTGTPRTIFTRGSFGPEPATA